MAGNAEGQLSLTPAFETGVLYRDDNIEVLRTLPDKSVDLVYLDPPFFSNRFYEVIWGEEAEVRSFEDRWAGGIQHYVDWMKGRVFELHRVLKATGSLYLHCDPHASHYLKVLLDGVFGMEHFRNEIIWRRTPFSGSSKARARQLPRSHDVLLFYTKSADSKWHGPTQPYSAEYLKRFKWQDQRGKYRKTLLKTFSQETFERLQAEDRLVPPVRKGAKYSYKQYLHESSGTRQLDDVWTDINMINPVATERLGYPTQKPEALLERIIQASSDPGDIVLDPFCGCGTTVAVADRLQRQWIGIDVSATAVEIMRRRLLKQGCKPKISNAVESLTDLKALKPFEFQNWIINAIYGTHSPKKVGDMGIDGYWFFTREPVQVKQSERVGRNVVDNFETAVRRAEHDAGYIIAFSFTRGAVEEAARVKKEGLDIRLVKVAEVMLLVKRPHGKLGPQPGTVEELPLPPMRKPKDLPTAEELIDSDKRTA